MVKVHQDLSTPKFSEQDKAYYLSQLHAAYEAAIVYDGSEAADERLYEPLNNLDQFVMKANGGQIDESLERVFSKAADPDWAKDHPHTVRALMEEAAKFYTRLQNVNSFEAVIDSLENSGAHIIRSEAVYIETDDMAPAMGTSDDPEKFEVRTQPRLAMLIKNLQEIGIYTDDLLLHVGQVRDDMMRQYPYVVVQIPRLGKEIAVCDQVGEATFVGHMIHDVGVWEHLTKQQMNDRDDFDRVVFRDEPQWWDELHGHLRGDAPQVAKTAKKDVAKFARKKPPLDIDLIKQSIKATYEATGEWVTIKSRDVLYGHYANLGEKWANIEAALTTAGRGITKKSSLTSLKAEVANENGWNYQNHLGQADLTIQGIKDCIKETYQKTSKWVHRKCGDIEYGPYANKGENWGGIPTALKDGLRGLPKDTATLASLKQEVAKENGWDYKNLKDRPNLNIADIKLCIAAHYFNTDGEWVTEKNENVLYGPYAGQDEKWNNIATSLRASTRNLPEGHTLSSLKSEVAQEYGWLYQSHLEKSDLTIEGIKDCIKAHYEATGQWVSENSGDVLYGVYAGHGEKWMNIGSALINGRRGIPDCGYTIRSLKEEVAAENGWFIPPSTAKCWAPT